MIYEFSDLTLDLDRHLLIRDGRPIKLTKLSFKVLQVLVQAAPALVTHDDLIDQVWGPRRVISPDNLSQRMKTLRQSLGDDPNQPIYIEGVRGEGYRLVPEVKIQSVPVSSQPGRQAPSTRLLVSLVVLALALGYIAFDNFVLDPEKRAQSARLESLTAAPGESHGEKSIAVLPFVNVSSDPEQEYFSDGITEEILNLLTKIPELKVTSRTSVFSFKGQRIDVPTVAEKLGVEHILEGSVRKSGNRVRVTAQLIEARNDVHLWSETYERKLDDIFAIQDEIASEVAKALQVHLLGAAPLATTTSIEAYKLYLRGKHFAEQRNKDSLETSITAYRESIALDENFAPSWAGLADVLRRQGSYGYVVMQEAMEASRDAARRALELDTELSEAWAVLAEIQFYYDWDWARAEVSTSMALKHGPKNASVLRLATWVSLGLGDTERALDLARRAVDLDPLDYSGLVNLGTTYWALGQREEEEKAYRNILELYPDSTSVKSFLAILKAAEGKPEEGLQYLDFDSEARWPRVFSAIVLHGLGRHEEEHEIRQAMIDDKGQLWAFHIAMTYACHGDPDKAFEWLNTAFEQRDYFMPQLTYNPWLASLHDDPRWLPILKKMERSQPRVIG